MLREHHLRQREWAAPSNGVNGDVPCEWVSQETTDCTNDGAGGSLVRSEGNNKTEQQLNCENHTREDVDDEKDAPGSRLAANTSDGLRASRQDRYYDDECDEVHEECRLA